MLNEIEKKELNRLADSGAFELVKKDLLSMQFELYLHLKREKDEKKEKDVLTLIRLLDTLIVRMDKYKSNNQFEKEVNGKTITTTKILEDNTKLGEWLMDYWLFNK